MAKGRITKINFKEQTITFVYTYKWFWEKPDLNYVIKDIKENAVGVGEVTGVLNDGKIVITIKFNEKKLHDDYEKYKEHFDKKPTGEFNIISQEQALINVCKNSRSVW